MVAEPKIRCAIVAIPADDTGMTSTHTFDIDGDTPSRFRPSDLLPWADPYIAGLVRKLQAEVRTERRSANRVAALLQAEAEVPATADGFDFPADDNAPQIDGDRWSDLDEAIR